MNAELLRRAATQLRDPYLVNFPLRVALALADWLDATAEDYGGDEMATIHAVVIARAVLREEP